MKESSPSGSTYYYYDTGGDLVGLKKNNTTYIVHDNLRGDIESVTDTSGNIVAQYHFDPWGNQITYSGTLTQSFRYAGYYYDDETGLYYLKSRYYSPTLGRFLTRDDIKYIKHTDPETLNLYSYCQNNPVSFTDPDGNFVIADDLAALAALAAAAVALVNYLGSEEAQAAMKQMAADTTALIAKMESEIANLKKRAEGPSGVQYSLRATNTSDYYVDAFGNPVHLNAGDVWKYGETTNLKGRYSDTWLKASGLYIYPEFYGSQLECKIEEKKKLYAYFFIHWNLPPGNKIFR